MERFVQYVVAGGLALVAGLWLTALTPSWSAPWLLGTVAALAGGAGTLAGIWRELAF